MNHTIQAFIEGINTHNIQSLGELMSEDHTFVDAHGNEVVGRTRMIAGWQGYFGWFPDYYIEVEALFEQGDAFALFGFAGGSFKGNPNAEWRLPAAWKATVKDGRVSFWQVFADTKIPFDIVERNS